MKRARGNGKSRSGCQQCKDRKIKCDENKPECDACVRSGVRCPGYVRPLRWSRKHEKHESDPLKAIEPNEQPDLSTTTATTLSTDDSPPQIDLPEVAGSPTRMPDWLNLNFDGYNAELAFQDATALMAQDLTETTLPFLSGAPMLIDETLPAQNFRFDPESSDTIDDVSISPLIQSDSDSVGHGQILSTGLASRSNNLNLSTYRRPATRGKAASGSCALLHTFYRLSSPKPLRRLSDEDFVHYYFKHVCRLHSCFDSETNTFRVLAAKWWSTCPTVSLVIQSLAIAHIANSYPYIVPLGLSKRWEAWRSLQKDLQLHRKGQFDLDKALLCLFLLGISASWLHDSHLGLQYLHITRSLIQTRLQNSALRNDDETLNEFWAGALVYWEMLVSLVDPVPITTFDGYGLPDLRAQAIETPVVPHPWTGIVTELHFVLAEIGRVLRRRRRCSSFFNPYQDSQPLPELDHPWLQNLEQLLLTTQIPGEDMVEDFHDLATSKTDLIRTAQAFRLVGLLEIYSLSPELLQDRIEDTSENIKLPFTIPLEMAGYARSNDSFLASMAKETIQLISKVNLSSGACRLQPLLLMSCASQLRFPQKPDGTNANEPGELYVGIDQHRYVVESRMLALSRKLPQAPILKGIEINKEVWDRLDNGDDGHWVDVMHEKGWSTILG